jgi:hypothetical protein
MEPTSPERPSLATVEGTILSSWRNVLGLPGFGLHDRPFDAGATSAGLLRVHHEIERRLNVTIAPMALFEHPTVAELARYVHDSFANAGAPRAPEQRAQDSRLGARLDKRRLRHGGTGRRS